MKVADVIHGRISTADLRRTDGNSFPANLPVQSEVTIAQRPSGENLLAIGGVQWEVEGADRTNSVSLREIAERGLPMLAWLVQPVPKRGPAVSVLVQFHEFTEALSIPASMEIGIDDRAVEDLRQRLHRQVSVAGAIEWLTERMLLPPRQAEERPRALLSGVPSGETAAFRIHGHGFAIDVGRARGERLLVNRIVESRRRMESEESRPLHLATANIQFLDASMAGEFRGEARDQLDLQLAQADSYLGFWQQYNDKERQVILAKARQFGWVKYGTRKRESGGSWRFDVSANEADLADLRRRLDALDGQHLEAGDRPPSVIEGNGVNKLDRGSRRPFIGEPSSNDRPSQLRIRPLEDRDQTEPPEKGYLFVSVGGDEVRVNRRREAWQKVRDANNQMPQLGLLLEGRPVREQRRRRLEPLTRAVRDVFANPSDRQRNALDIALNTPDIALIQGPPGTGKTKVLAALQARLAEQDEGVGQGGLTGNTLLTSYQHDAVENAAAATRVMGLPAVKVGYRRGTEEARDGVDAWAVQTAQVVRAAPASAPMASGVHAALRDVRQIAVASQALAPTETQAKMLRQVSEIASPWLPGALADELSRLCTELSAPMDAALGVEDQAGTIKAIRALRTDAVAFSDDGARNAYLALKQLRRLGGFLLEDAEVEVLDRAGSWEPTESPTKDLLASLQTAKEALLDRLQPAEIATAHLRHTDTESLLVRVIDALTTRAKETAPGVDMAVEDWLATLENDPDGTREAVRHYSMVLAATCQQAVSRPMEEAKHGEDTVFRTVIVDEAARANPLDLLIPMSLAERRIILVGDHRQLPHLLEPDVERELRESAEDMQEEMRDALRFSLFEKLFTELRRREKRDGIQRTVTLDRQYRMHPRLGSFVSQQFYEPHGEPFEQGRGEDDFVHGVSLANGIPLTGKIAVWVDVPFNQGGESHGRSKRRTVEAQRVADEVHAVATQHPSLTVGVITFYAAQRDEILSALLAREVAEQDDQGIRIRDEWRQTTDGRERLRVGTVDAFQGKEFDVVFLSLTRSNRVSGDDAPSLRRRYGFLLLENRLCVAMSRQQRLLVVVGDAAMAVGTEAHSALPALVAFRTLCEGPHGSLIRS